MKYTNGNDSEKSKLNDDANDIIKILEELGEMEYSDYKPEETYRFFEKSRGKCIE
jgi:hypothetical protein